MYAQNVAYPSLHGPLHSSRQMAVASFIGSPLAGALLLRANYKALNDGGTGAKALLRGMGASALRLVVAQYLPSYVPNSTLPVL